MSLKGDRICYERINFNKRTKIIFCRDVIKVLIAWTVLTVYFLKFLFHQGCFIMVMTIIESEMGVIAGISFGVACFQVSPCSQEMFHHSCRCRLQDFHFKGFEFLPLGPVQQGDFLEKSHFHKTQSIISVETVVLPFPFQFLVVLAPVLPCCLPQLQSSVRPSWISLNLYSNKIATFPKL